jgi:Mycobacterial 4 TMS phage holin, superfamily IV
MRRTVISLALLLGANAIGLIVAAALLDKMELDWAAFIFALIIFTIVEAVALPGVRKVAESKAPAISSGVALIATFVALLITDVLSDGLDIEGIGTWVLATLIVWVCTMVATLVLQKLFGPERGRAPA